jgi:hypothetical protein
LEKKLPATAGNQTTISQFAALMSRTYGYKFGLSSHNLRKRWDLLRRAERIKASGEPCNESFTSAAQYPNFLNIYHRNHIDDERYEVITAVNKKLLSSGMLQREFW